MMMIYPGIVSQERGMGTMRHGDNRDMDQCIQILTHDTADATAELYTRVFLEDEPMTRHHGINPKEFLPCAREYLHFCADQELSFIAVDRVTSQVVAFVLGSDLTTDLYSVGPGMVTLLSFFRESMEIIEELESRCPDISNAKPGMIFHIFQIGTHCNSRRYGLVKQLIRLSLSRAADRGFVKAVAECTGSISRHTCERCGFHCAAYIRYDDFITDGKAFFSGLPGGISLMIRDI